MEAASLRRWLDGRRAAEEREHAEQRATPLSPAESMRQALRLIALASRLHGWPLPDDPRSEEEDRLGYERWDRLRAAWRRERDGLY